MHGSHSRARWLLVALMLAAAAYMDVTEPKTQGAAVPLFPNSADTLAAPAGYIESSEQIEENQNDKPVDSYPGQWAWDGTDWVEAE